MPSDSPTAGRTRGWRIGLLVVVGLITIGVWWAARVPDESWTPLAAPPNPNGFDSLVKGGKMIVVPWPNKGDLARAPVDEIRPFLARNAAALAEIRLGLGREGRAVFANSFEGLDTQMDQATQVRAGARLLVGEARVAEADSRYGDAAHALVDDLKLGQMSTQGAMGLGASTGWALQSQAVDLLRPVVTHLTLIESTDLIRELEILDVRRVEMSSVEALEARWHRWYVGNFPFWQRIMMKWNGVEAKGREGEKAASLPGRARVERSMRFLLVASAVHAHHLRTGRWPKSIDEMVPGELAKVPVDPSTGKPIDYPKDDREEMVDDLSTIGQVGVEGAKP